MNWGFFYTSIAKGMLGARVEIEGKFESRLALPPFEVDICGTKNS